jgi:hypothetical protein
MNSDNTDLPGTGATSTGPADSPIQASRRRLFRGVAGGTGVLLAVHAKTALGTGVSGVCQSPSAMMSGNTSPRPGSGVTCSGGRSPGFWKVPQKFSYWASTGATPPQFNVGVVECGTGMQGLALENIVPNTGTMLTQIGFTGAPANTTLWAVLAFPGSFPNGQLLRHLVAAWLNAGYFTSAGSRYPLTREQIIEMWNETRGGGTYCPASLMSCGTTGWTATQVISFIEGMYDINSNVDPNLCKTN